MPLPGGRHRFVVLLHLPAVRPHHCTRSARPRSRGNRSLTSSSGGVPTVTTGPRRRLPSPPPPPSSHFSTVLARLTHGTAIDALDPASPALFDLYLIVNNVEGLAPGTYVLHRERGVVELLDAGDKRAGAARIAYDQDYAAQAHVNV